MDETVQRIGEKIYEKAGQSAHRDSLKKAR